MAGTVVATGVLATAALLVTAFGAVGGAAVWSQRLAAAADAAALAAADAASGAVEGAPCVRAAEAAAAHGVGVGSCGLDGLVATVRVEGVFAGLPASATARAGPPPEGDMP